MLDASAGEPSVAAALSSVLPPPSELALYSVITLYFVVSLTIPFWVPILKRVSGECGVFWVRACRSHTIC